MDTHETQDTNREPHSSKAETKPAEYGENGNRDGRGRMGRRWPWRLGAGGQHEAPADPRQAWQEAAPAARGEQVGSMILADELAERRRQRESRGRDPLPTAGRVWQEWRPPAVDEAPWQYRAANRSLAGGHVTVPEIGEPAGWLDPAGPDLERTDDERRLDELDELDGLGLVAPAVTLAARELDAAGNLDRARAIVRGALGVLDDIAGELDDADAKLGAARLAGELGDAGDEAPWLGAAGDLGELGDLGDDTCPGCGCRLRLDDTCEVCGWRPGFGELGDQAAGADAGARGDA